MQEPAPTRIEFAPGLSVARVKPPLRLADYRLVAFDMDSTLISIECIDEIAEIAGRGAEVAAITEAAMRGEIPDYAESLRQRLTLLRGVPESALEQVWTRRLTLNPGAAELIATLKAQGLRVLLVSGGFTYFTERLQQRLGLDRTRANELVITAGRLTGEVRGEIVDAAVKARTVLEMCTELGCQARETIVVGDGANDLAMMRLAGLSVAYRAKPSVRAQADLAIDSGGLDRLLEVFAPLRSGDGSDGSPGST